MALPYVRVTLACLIMSVSWHDSENCANCSDALQVAHLTLWVWLTTLRCLLSSRSRRSRMAVLPWYLCW